MPLWLYNFRSSDNTIVHTMRHYTMHLYKAGAPSYITINLDAYSHVPQRLPSGGMIYTFYDSPGQFESLGESVAEFVLSPQDSALIFWEDAEE